MSNQPKVYADGTTTPPQAQHQLTDQDWDALLDDPAVAGFLASAEPKQLLEHIRGLHHQLKHLRGCRQKLDEINVALHGLAKVAGVKYLDAGYQSPFNEMLIDGILNAAKEGKFYVVPKSLNGVVGGIAWLACWCREHRFSILNQPQLDRCIGTCHTPLNDDSWAVISNDFLHIGHA